MHYARFSLLVGYVLFAESLLSAGVLVAGTNPDSSGLDFVSNTTGPGGVFSLEQLFTLTSAAQITSLEINAASFSSQTLKIQLFNGLGLEGTGTLLKTFNVSIPGTYDGSDIPTIMISTSMSLGSGSYSLLFSDPNSSPDLIYLNVALSLNTPDGSLGGTNWSTGITGGANMVFELDGTVAGSTPEPGSMWLLGIGLLGFTVVGPASKAALTLLSPLRLCLGFSGERLIDQTPYLPSDGRRWSICGNSYSRAGTDDSVRRSSLVAAHHRKVPRLSGE